eukprot:Gb_09320 [translate_table: standard]
MFILIYRYGISYDTSTLELSSGEREDVHKLLLNGWVHNQLAILDLYYIWKKAQEEALLNFEFYSPPWPPWIHEDDSLKRTTSFGMPPFSSRNREPIPFLHSRGASTNEPRSGKDTLDKSGSFNDPPTRFLPSGPSYLLIDGSTHRTFPVDRSPQILHRQIHTLPIGTRNE